MGPSWSGAPDLDSHSAFCVLGSTLSSVPSLKVLRAGFKHHSAGATPWALSWSAYAAITKSHRLGGLHNTYFLSHGSAGRKPGIKALGRLSVGEGSLPGLQAAASSVCMEGRALVFLLFLTRISVLLA